MGPILIVDDQREVREPLAELLEWEGFIPIPVASAASALSLIESLAAPPAVVLLDLEMPGMDGTAFLAERARRPKVAAVPVVVLAPSADVAPGRVVGAQAVVSKPVDLAALVLTIERLATGPG